MPWGHSLADPDDDDDDNNNDNNDNNNKNNNKWINNVVKLDARGISKR